MTSQIRVDEITNRSGLGTVTIYDNGFEFTGVTTFTEDVDITGGLTIGGVLTYEDTTNIDSVGLITARAGIRVTGDVGINRPIPSAALDVESTTDQTVLRIRNNAGNNTRLLFANAAAGLGEIFYQGDFRFVDDENSDAERLRITSAGNLGIGDASPTKPLTVGTTTPVILLDDQSSRTLEIRGPSTTHIASILTTSGHALLLGTNNSERLRIDANGTLLVNAAIDNTGGHGQIVAHAPTTGNTIYKAIEIGNTDGNGTARGAAIVGQPQSNSHLPYTLIGSWDHGDNTDVYYGGGWGGAMRPATRHRFYTNSSYPTTGGSGTEVVRITENGDLGINILDPQEKLHVHILKNSGSTSTTRTKQHAAMRLSLQRNGGSAPYYGWGPALDFYSDNYDGSTRRPNARIAGVISNSSVDHEGGQLRFYTTANDTATSETDFTERMRIYADGIVTKPYQPAFMAKLSTATGQNFNGTLIFNSVNHNIGGHYNSSNGRFTAPVAGRYLFNWYTNVDTNSNSTSLWGDWLINGSYTNYRFYTYVNHTGWELLTASIIFNLSANDYVNVYVSTSGNYDGGSYGSFNGCLLG